MARRWARRLAALLLLAVARSEGGSNATTSATAEEPLRRTCGTKDLSAEAVRAVEVERAAFADAVKDKGAPLPHDDGPGWSVNVPVVFHVLHDGAAGLVPRRRCEAQVAVLNDAFAGRQPGATAQTDTGIGFTLSDVVYHDDPLWFTTCRGSWASIMSAYAVDPARTLNVYTCLPAQNVLGFITTFPDEAPEGSWRHGVILRHDTLPGGGLAPYDLGDTAVHEVGHHFGLYHTFNPNDGVCRENGDAVEDTPAERSPAFGTCAQNWRRDTCPGVGGSIPPYFGLDPVSSFMDYTEDSCMTEFSPGQSGRMRLSILQFKPTLCLEMPSGTCSDAGVPPPPPPDGFCALGTC